MKRGCMNSLLANERKNSVGADYVHSQINPAMAVGADLSAPILINLSDLTMSPLRFARGQALSAAKGLARGAARSFPFTPFRASAHALRMTGWKGDGSRHLFGGPRDPSPSLRSGLRLTRSG